MLPPINFAPPGLSFSQVIFSCLLLVVQAKKNSYMESQTAGRDSCENSTAAGYLTAEEVAAEQFKRYQGRKRGQEGDDN